ncbi:thioredoxin reductase [Denitrovibrio acetiphilus DSM 12809]|uniref:Thioredoxin reductase n=1 Tax=Denitrovibrio acetiphilus (strain DSM 12809 / NBRC 114555 / N2460) TaxID=522772 RepID=D4H0J6_DENA2|nr:thioredoxin-disulfide reductase [Denitrovibrio acetiphilus]ADD68509.1 thioredoxin reductase [Denitrovibrio acetiphilus DSM 12809]
MQDFFNVQDIKDEYDIVVLGAGPAGLTAAMYAARDKQTVLVLEKQFPGGFVAITEWVENYPGFFDGIMGADLSEKFYQHAVKYGALVRSGNCTNIEKDGKYKLVHVENRETPVKCKAVIITFGCEPKRLDVPGENKFYGRGVSFCATCDGSFYKDKEVAVVGGGESALEEGMYLTKFANKVTVIHRRDQFRASKLATERAQNNEKMEFIYDSVVESINGDTKVECLTVKNLKTGNVTELAVDGLFIFIGQSAKTELVKDLVDTDEWGFIIATESTQTSEPGIYVAGDVRTKEYRQITTAVSDGTVAAKSCEKYITDNFS